MSKEHNGFSLLEVIISIALGILLILCAFSVSHRFSLLFRKLEKKGQDNCMCYTALQLLRADLEAAPMRKSSYKDLSSHIIHFYLSDGSSLKWQFNEQKHTLTRIHFYTKNTKLTEDVAVVLENVDECSFAIDLKEMIEFISVSLTHNGRSVQSLIKLRNRKL